MCSNKIEIRLRHVLNGQFYCARLTLAVVLQALDFTSTIFANFTIFKSTWPHSSHISLQDNNTLQFTQTRKCRTKRYLVVSSTYSVSWQTRVRWKQIGITLPRSSASAMPTRGSSCVITWRLTPLSLSPHSSAQKTTYQHKLSHAYSWTWSSQQTTFPTSQFNSVQIAQDWEWHTKRFHKTLTTYWVR